MGLLWCFVVLPRFSPIHQVFDLNGFGTIGENIAIGKGFSNGAGPTMRRAPLYPTLIAGVFNITGYNSDNRERSYTPLIVLQCFFAGLSCLCVYLIGRQLFGERTGVLAGVLCAFWPQCLRYLGAVDVEATNTLLITLITLATVHLRRSPNIKNGALAGLAIGAATLVKPLPLLFPLVIALLLWPPKGVRYPAKALAACILTLVAICLPWVVRNHIVSHGRFHGISTNAAGEFLRGYVNARPEYVLLKKPFQGSWDWDANMYEEAILMQHGFGFFSIINGQTRPMIDNVQNELTKDGIEAAEIRRRIVQEPGGILRKWVIQIFTFWYIVETPAKAIMVGIFALLALIPAAIGVKSAVNHGKDYLPPVAVVLYFNILYAAVLSFARYSMPIFPTLLVLSAYGWLAIFTKYRHQAVSAS